MLDLISCETEQERLCVQMVEEASRTLLAQVHWEKPGAFSQQQEHGFPISQQQEMLTEGKAFALACSPLYLTRWMNAEGSIPPTAFTSLGSLRFWTKRLLWPWVNMKDKRLLFNLEHTKENSLKSFEIWGMLRRGQPSLPFCAQEQDEII